MNQFIFKNAANKNLFTLDSSGNATLSGTLTTSVGNYDVAEDYPTQDSTLSAGDVLTVDPNHDGHVIKSSTPYENTVIGVYSENPGFRLSEKDNMIQGDKAIPVALTGRVPVNVSTKNGPIHKGDYLTSSSMPGVAMKATKPGEVIGKALEDFNCVTSVVCEGKINTFINISFADPTDTLANIISGNNNVQTSALSTSDIKLPTTMNIGGKEVQGTLTDALLAMSNTISEHENTIGILQTNVLSQATASAFLANKVNDLENSQASLSAQLSQNTNAIASTSASVDLLNKKIEDEFTNMIATTTPFVASSASELGLDNLNASIATISGTLNVLGRTTVTDLGVTGTIATGVLSINGLDDTGEASINTIGTLKLQDHGTGTIDILSGKVVVDSSGNVTINNSLTAHEVTTDKLNIASDTTSSQSAVLSASAGVSVITAGNDTIIINTTAVTNNSLIYVTFNGDYSPAVRYWVDSKTAGTSFTVKLDAQVAHDAKFNWWIVN